MKNYEVYLNTETRPFHNADRQRIGSTPAKSKKDAIQKVYEAFWGVDNEANIDLRFSGDVTPSTKKRMSAEID